MNEYPITSAVHMSATFTNSAGNPADPTAVTFRLRLPNGTLVNYTYGTDAQLTKDSTGVYSVIYTASAAGIYTYYFRGTGAVQAGTDDTQFRVIASSI